MKKEFIPFPALCERSNAKLGDHRNDMCGTVFLRNVIFVLLLAILIFFLLTYQSSESIVLEKIERIKIGMAQAQVETIMGSPKRSERAPFSKNSLPITDSGIPNNQESNDLLMSIRRDHYELGFTSSDDKFRFYNLDVYYDNQSRVRFIYRSLNSELMWDLVEMY